MKPALHSLLLLSLLAAPGFAQEAGNRVNQGQQLQQGKDVSRRQPNYPSSSTDSVTSEQPNLLVTQYQFIDAKVLTSLETREYVAVFGLSQQADKVNDANRKLQEQVSAFLGRIWRHWACVPKTPTWILSRRVASMTSR